MPGFESPGKFLVLSGVFLTILGLLLVFGQKIPFLGKLPGNILLQNEKVRFFFPLGTCLVLSAVLTIPLNFIIKLFDG